jgi:hypothetical protein
MPMLLRPRCCLRRSSDSRQQVSLRVSRRIGFATQLMKCHPARRAQPGLLSGTGLYCVSAAIPQSIPPRQSSSSPPAPIRPTSPPRLRSCPYNVASSIFKSGLAQQLLSPSQQRHPAGQIPLGSHGQCICDRNPSVPQLPDDGSENLRFSRASMRAGLLGQKCTLPAPTLN